MVGMDKFKKIREQVLSEMGNDYNEELAKKLLLKYGYYEIKGV